MSETPTFLSENPTFLSDFSHPDFRTEKISFFHMATNPLWENCPNRACQEKRFSEIVRILPVRKTVPGKLSEFYLSGETIQGNCPNPVCLKGRFKKIVLSGKTLQGICPTGYREAAKMGKAVASTTCLSCLWAEAIGKVRCWERRRSERGSCMLPGSDRLERHRCATRCRLCRIFYDSQIAKGDCVS